MIAPDAEASVAAGIAETYRDAVERFDPHRREEWFARAYDIGRTAIQTEIPISAIVEVHNALLHCVPVDDGERRSAVEEFFLEVLSVYDMVLHGYRDAVTTLKKEVAERRKVSERLSLATEELARQRDALDDQVREQTRDLREQARRLAETNREQAEFTYAVSHDLKSPANTVGMLLRELSVSHGATLDEDALDLLDMSVATVDRMGQLIVDVLNYSQAIETDFAPEPVSLDALMEDIRADLRGQIDETGATLSVGKLPAVMGNPMQLRMLFQNLVANGLKFHGPGGRPLVSVTGRPAARPGHAAFRVTDNGIGIAQEDQTRIFGLFQRLHVHDAFPGSGLGLTLCQRIAGNHGGTITVQSAPGEGATFAFSLRSDGL